MNEFIYESQQQHILLGPLQKIDDQEFTLKTFSYVYLFHICFKLNNAASFVELVCDIFYFRVTIT